jgi:4-oxalocrotonate tautomerase
MVTVQLTREGSEPGLDRITREQKAGVIKGISQVLLDVLGKPLDWTWVVIEEVELDNWGQGGLPIVDYRKARAAQ